MADTFTDLCAEFRTRCITIGQIVNVTLPSGAVVNGTAEGVDDAGRLIVDGQTFSSGDIVHARPAQGFQLGASGSQARSHMLPDAHSIARG